MPGVAETDMCSAEALDLLCDHLDTPAFKNSVGAKDRDINFLSEIMNNTVTQSVVRAHDTLEDCHNYEPVSCDNIDLVQDILADLEIPSRRNQLARELLDILSDHHIQALIEAHDDIAAQNFEELTDVVPVFTPPTQLMHPSPTANNPIRMVGIRKSPEEPLGITVRRENDDLVIARIMTGSMIERQGLLHVGDVIREINGHEVNNPNDMQELMKKSSGNVTLKVIPSCYDANRLSEMFVRAHFSYDPRKDNLIPCREAGLPFKEGDILELLNMDDANWWQARKVDDNQMSGLVPSQALEERRKAFVRPEYDYTHKSLLCGIMTKKKKKMMYHSRMNSDLDRHDLMIYEEVGEMPPFQRSVIIIIGAQGVGRRTLKNRLIKANPKNFSTITPFTSRPIRSSEADGDGYRFISADQFLEDVHSNEFLEYGEYDGNLYGTKFESIVELVDSGKMVLLDINPQALKVIKTSQFMPYVVFVAAAPVEIMRNMHEQARQRYKTTKMKTERDFRNTFEESARIERRYKKFFDLTIVNDNIDETYNKLSRAIEQLNTESQWVPISWVY